MLGGCTPGRRPRASFPWPTLARAGGRRAATPRSAAGAAVAAADDDLARDRLADVLLLGVDLRLEVLGHPRDRVGVPRVARLVVPEVRAVEVVGAVLERRVDRRDVRRDQLAAGDELLLEVVADGEGLSREERGVRSGVAACVGP